MREPIPVRDAVTVCVVVAVVRIQSPTIFGIVLASIETVVVARLPLMRYIVVGLVVRTARVVHGYEWYGWYTWYEWYGWYTWYEWYGWYTWYEWYGWYTWYE